MSNHKQVLMCARVDGPLLLPDNLTGPCSECWSLVQYRPHAPDGIRLICMECALPNLTPNDRLVTTQRMIDDALRYFNRKKQ
jgi:hypothetical protein